MNPSRALLIALLLAGLLAGPAGAAFDTYFDVAQPIENEDRGVEIHHVVYRGYFGRCPVAMEVRLTCSPSCYLWADRPNPLRPDSSDDDKNSAHLLGLVVSVEEDEYLAGDRFPDTLHVTLDARAAIVAAAAQDSAMVRRLSLQDPRFSPKTPWDTSRQELDEVVAATVDCILDNASRSCGKPHFVMLRVDGPESYQRFARLYRLLRAPRPKFYEVVPE